MPAAVLEPPSPHLESLLSEFQICSARDLRGCRHRVKRLARDLPAFDSVWIDALVQAGKLTTFQARIIESGRSQQLRVGPCLLVDQLGAGEVGETFLARRLDGTESCVLKQLSLAAEEVRDVSARLAELISVGSRVEHPSVVVPHAWNETSGQLNTLSLYVSGPTLADLLIRRGRFPAVIVAEIGRQILGGLAALEEVGIVHGDLRAWNIRMTVNGVVVAVDAGIVSATRPELTIRSNYSPDRYEGVAPELIGTGNPPTASSDLYTLGCLLWQLLAGRPPFSTGDPLAKLAAHQTRDVIDVREWAPDTPQWLAESIQRFTSRDPALRPTTIQQAKSDWHTLSRSGRKQLSQFRATFNSSLPRVRRNSSTAFGDRWSVLIVTVMVMAGVVLTLVDQGARNHLLSIASDVATKLRGAPAVPHQQNDVQPPDSSDATDAHQAALQRIPPPDSNGIIHLSGNRPFAATDIAIAGSVILRGAGESPAEIVVGADSLTIRADQVLIENVRFRREQSATSTSKPASDDVMLDVHSHDLVVANSAFARECEATVSRPLQQSLGPAIQWQLQNAHSRIRSYVHFRNLNLSNCATAIRLQSCPAVLLSENCLQIGGESHIGIRGAIPTGDRFRISIVRSTIRGSQSLVRNVSHGFERHRGHVLVEASDSVFDFATPGGSFFDFVGTDMPADWMRSMEVQGSGSLTVPGVSIVTKSHPEMSDVETLDSGEMAVEGLLTANFEYVGPPTTDPANSMIADHDAVRRSTDMPGIDASLLIDAVGNPIEE